MRTARQSTIWAAFAILAIAAASSSRADSLALGSQLVTPDTSTGAGWTAVSAPMDSPLTDTAGPDNLSGNLHSQVFSDGAGHLVFEYQITLAAPTTTSVESLSLSDFGRFAIADAGYLLNSGTVAPLVLGRSLDGKVVDALFPNSPALGANTTSATVFVLADASSFTVTPQRLQGNAQAVADGFSPAPDVAVPQPTSVVAGGFGLLGVMSIAWLRHRAGR